MLGAKIPSPQKRRVGYRLALVASSLTWIDYDGAARERTKCILALFQEREARDKLGVGAVYQSLSDQLFPGTSTIQARLRYMLFVPWVYQGLVQARDHCARAGELCAVGYPCVREPAAEVPGARRGAGRRAPWGSVAVGRLETGVMSSACDHDAQRNTGSVCLNRLAVTCIERPALAVCTGT
jgi:hypothetical protein